MRKLTFAAAAALQLLSGSLALAQTAPNWTYGYVPTQAQWNAVFAGKQDYLGSPPLLTNGGTMTGPLITAASTTPTAGLNLPAGVAPTSPNNGDMWTTSSGLFVRINGSTVGPLISASGIGSFAGTSPILFTSPGGVITYSFDFTVANTFLAQQTNQGASGTSPGWYAQLTGDTNARVRVGLNAADVSSIGFGPGNAVRDAFIERLGAGSLRFGTADAASAVAQTISVQNVLAGTSNTAGAALTIAGSRGTGSGAGGSIALQTAPAGGSGTSQNALVTAMTVFGSGGISTGAATDQGAGTLNLSGALYNAGTAPTGTGAYVRATSPTLTNNITLTLGSDATGDIYYRNSSGFIARLPIGGAANVLTVSAGLPAWNAPPGGGNVSNSGSPTNGQAAQWTSSTVIKGVTWPTLQFSTFAASSTFTTPANGTTSTVYHFRMAGPGAGGQGGNTGNTVGAGGGAGGFAEYWCTGVAASTGITITIGTGGAAGASGGGTAGAGSGASSFTCNGTTVTANAGGVSTGAGPGGAGGTATGSGAILQTGENGSPGGVASAGSVPVYGRGGNNPLGYGGVTNTSTGVGAAGTGCGSGGSPGFGNLAGGAGKDGCVYVDYVL